MKEKLCEGLVEFRNKERGFGKKIFITVMTIYIIYQLGYAIGTFLAHIGL